MFGHAAAMAVMLAWSLWFDQTSYNLRTRENRAGPIQGEGVAGRRELIATTATKAECEALGEHECASASSRR